MPMSEASRAAASERMKKLRADQKAKKERAPADPALQEALAKAPFVTEARTAEPLNGNIVQEPLEGERRLSHYSNHITIKVEWETLPIQEAQQFYAALKVEFERAGKILNGRLMAEHEGYTCFMCHTYHEGRPGMTDLSYQDPKTGLFPRVDLCGELCVVNYHKLRIDMRTAKHIDEAAQQRGA
jgi:hypothetical protein